MLNEMTRGAVAVWWIVGITGVWAESPDTNADGLPDVWQEQYEAYGIAPDADADGDRYTNLQEALSGTNPWLASDFPQLQVLRNETAGNTVLSFPTQPGKRYQVHQSSSIGDFLSLGPIITGDGLPYTLEVTTDAQAQATGNVLLEQWADVAGNQLSTLQSLPGFPFQPDGSMRLDRLEAPLFLASGFGGRLVTYITPPQDGAYTFYLSSGSSAQLHLSSSADLNDFTTIAAVLSAQSDLAPGEWNRYENQRSTPQALMVGESNLLQVDFLSHVSESHCQLAWSGPGIDGVQIISAEHLASQPMPQQSAFSSPILSYDYDTEGQTALLWPGTALVPAPAGMTGNAEAMTADPGAASVERIPLSGATTDHFYGRFLVHIGTGNTNSAFMLQSGSGGGEEGPRIDFELRSSGTIPAIRAGGSGGSEGAIDVPLDATYQVEIVTALESDFSYRFDQCLRTVAPDHFDLYVSDPVTGEFFGALQGLTYRDGPGVVSSIDYMRFMITESAPPNLIFDDFHFTGGAIDGNGVLGSTFAAPPSPVTDRHFFTLSVADEDQDGDGLTDWEEIALGQHQPLLFFDAQTQTGTDDASSLETTLQDGAEEISVSLQASDTVAYEDYAPNVGENHGEILLTRTGSLSPVTVALCVAPLATTGTTATVCDGTCCTLVGTAGDEEAELEDYRLLDAAGNEVGLTVEFALGEMEKRLTVQAIKDSYNEYPETLNLALAPVTPDAAYTVSATNGASIQLIDLPDSPENNAIFTGLYSPDGNVVTPTSGSGSVSAILNGSRTKLYLTTEFTSLTSDQQDAHVHKSNPGSTDAQKVGPIIYEITITPGDAESDPLLGALDSYLWDLAHSAGTVPTAGGAASKQAIIDSLFGQNGETPLYFNIHTVDNPAGEIWSFLGLTGGSITAPAPPTVAALPGSADYPQLTGAALTIDVRRFLDQATFGATEDEVAALVALIEEARLTDPTYHRHAAFSDWIQAQVALPQTYLIDYQLAMDYQLLVLRGWYNPLINPASAEIPAPIRPATWPSVDRSAGPNAWHLTTPYPINGVDSYLYRTVNDNSGGGEPNDASRRQAQWQLMVNGQDQLRQKMGFALQQIVVASTANSSIKGSTYACNQYQDMLNYHAFSHYRDVLGFVNWSPVMGKWLTSLQNQKGLDLDGDGLFEISPDENLARENMQLFSIGLFEIWADGTLRLGSDGAPNNTYTNEDIKEFARVLTGQTFGFADNKGEGWGGTPLSALAPNTRFDLGQGSSGPYGVKYIYPMAMFGDYHDRGIKTFAGTTIDNTHLADPQAQGIADIEQALDWLAGSPDDGLPDYDMVNSHISTPAFCLLYTSPSPRDA